MAMEQSRHEHPCVTTETAILCQKCVSCVEALVLRLPDCFAWST